LRYRSIQSIFLRKRKKTREWQNVINENVINDWLKLRIQVDKSNSLASLHAAVQDLSCFYVSLLTCKGG